MNLRCMGLLAVLWAVGLCAASPSGVENLLRNSAFNGSFNEWELLGPRQHYTAGANGFTISIPESGARRDAGTHKLQQPQPLEVGRVYRLYMTVDSELNQERFIVVSYRMRNKPKNLGVFGRLPVHKGRQNLWLEIIPGALPDEAGDPSVLSFYLGELKGKVTISDMRLVDMSSVKAVEPPFTPQWHIFGLIPKDFIPGGEIPESIVGIDGKPVKPLLFRRKSVSTPAGSAINLRLEVGASRQRFKDTAVLYNVFEAPQDMLVPVGTSADWWHEIYLNGQSVYSTMLTGNGKKPHSPANHTVLLPVKKGRNVLAVKVMAGSEGWRFVWGAVQPPPPPIRFTAKEGYLPVDVTDLAVKAGSALDLSVLADAPAGKYGRAIINAEGQIVFEKNSKPQRFIGFSGEIPEEIWHHNSDADFEVKVVEYARAMRAQGYNLFRMHGFDQWIMAFAKEDFKPHERTMRRWDRIVAEMKKQGIYLQLDVLAFHLFAAGHHHAFQVAEKRMAHKVMFILGREWERERFRRGVELLLNHVNPYTGLAWKDDPAFIFVEYYNELGLGIPSVEKFRREAPDCFQFFMEKWKGFLRNKYGAMPANKRPAEYRNDNFENPGIPPYWDESQVRVDYDLMWYENFKATYDWCLKVVREAGYPGLTLNCPMPALRETPVSWEKLQVVDAHTYHCHPYNGEQPGSIVDDFSSVEREASAFRDMHGRRIYGRPFMANEYNYVFRNPYQYESPVAFAAYASLNNWSSLAVHASSVSLRGDNHRLSSFISDNNPVVRASEFLASLFFMRQDVAPSPHRIAIAVPKAYVFRKGISGRALSPLQSRLGLICNLAVMCPELPVPAGVPAPPKADLVLRPAGAGDIVWHGWYATAVDGAGDGDLLQRDVAALRKQGIIGPENRTDLQKQIYESDTGEILLRAKEKVLRVETARSEAVALPAGASEGMKHLTVESTSVNGLFGLAAVDQSPLKDSGRMVLVCSTRAANTGMEHAADNISLRVVGTTPILLQAGKFSLVIKSGKALKCYALRLNGQRQQELPLERLEGGAGYRLKVDTATLKHGPTPFFELVAE